MLFPQKPTDPLSCLHFLSVYFLSSSFLLWTMATKQLIAALRSTTGAGLMHCKKALEHSNGDIAAATAWLQEQGQLLAAKKASRATLKGAICVSINANKSSGVLMEVNVETDFCARNKTFLAFTQDLVQVALQLPGDQLSAEMILEAQMDGAPASSRMTSTIASIGENVALRRTIRVQAPAGSGIVSSYLHNSIAESPNHALLASMVAVSADTASMSDAEKLSLHAIGKRLAMHVTADRENKSPLLDQNFLQGDLTVGEWLEKQSKSSLKGSPVEVVQIGSLEVGEGLESAEDNFSEEVARQMAKAKK